MTACLGIAPIEQHQVPAARRLIASVCLELWRWPVTPEELERHWEAIGLLADMDDVRQSYFADRGIFLVLCDDERVVGTSAILRLDEEACELKRMWLAKEYRGQGWGRSLADRLLEFARAAGYRKVRLDLADPRKQQRALQFYERLGFYRIERYNDSTCRVFMEKAL